MAEPPAKRARRTDSAAMWDDEDGAAGTKSHPSKSSTYDKGDRRRSRSRDRNRMDSRRDRSRSRDRKYRDRDRREGYDIRDRERRGGDRSRSRDSYSTRKDAPHKPSRERSRSPPRNGTSTRTRTPPRGPRADRIKREPEDDRVGGRGDRKLDGIKKGATNGDAMHLDGPNGAHNDDDDDEDAVLRKVMGFTGFNTTQNKKVPGNDVYGVRKEKKTEYRQYMNRVGGFNRPLSPSR